jgi:hypothetical protein
MGFNPMGKRDRTLHLKIKLRRPTGSAAVKRSANWNLPKRGGYSAAPARFARVRALLVRQAGNLILSRDQY